MLCYSIGYVIHVAESPNSAGRPLDDFAVLGLGLNALLCYVPVMCRTSLCCDIVTLVLIRQNAVASFEVMRVVYECVYSCVKR